MTDFNDQSRGINRSTNNTYNREFEIGKEKAEWPSNPNSKKEKKYLLFCSKNIFEEFYLPQWLKQHRGRGEGGGGGLICSNERSISNTRNGWEPIKRRQTFAGGGKIGTDNENNEEITVVRRGPL